MRNLYIVLLLCIALCIPPASAAYAEGAAAMVAVTDVRVEPEILMDGDIGSVTVTITNTGDSSADIERITMYGKDVKIMNADSYDGGGTIGPGTSMSYTFRIQADVTDGTYFPIFQVSFARGGSLRYTIPVEVDSTPLSLSVTSAPDAWAVGEEEKVTLSIGNPRSNTISGIMVAPASGGVVSSETSRFIGELAPDESATVDFEITPVQKREIAFDLSYRNGNSHHTATVSIPVTFGEDKTDADLIVNGIEISSEGGATVLSGDVTNAGLSDAYAVVVTVGDPAEPVNPNPRYVVGYLEPDDFSSFKVSFTGGGGSVPLIIEYKDEYGNLFTENQEISVNSATSMTDEGNPSRNAPPDGGGPGRMMGGFGSGVSRIPFLEIGAAIVIGATALVAWRKGWLHAARDRLTQRRHR